MVKSKELFMQIREHLSSVCDAIEEGQDVDIFAEYRELYYFNKETELIQKQIKEYALAEAELYKPEELKKLGWEKRAGKTTWNYSSNIEYQQLKSELDSVQNDAKYLHNILFDKLDESEIEKELQKRGCTLDELKLLAATKQQSDPSFFPKKSKF